MEEYRQPPENVTEKPVMLTDIERAAAVEALYSYLGERSTTESMGYYQGPKGQELITELDAARQVFLKLIAETQREKTMTPSDWIRCGISQRVTPEEWESISADLASDPRDEVWQHQVQYFKQKIVNKY